MFVSNSSNLSNGSQKPAPFCMVIFGASGDLTKRKLIPALFGLFKENALPETFTIIGFARREKTDDSFREEMRDAVMQFSRFAPFQTGDWEAFAKHLFYHRGDFSDSPAYEALANRLKKEAETSEIHQHIFYLATAPEYFSQVVESLYAVQLVDHALPARVVIEKPFGHNLKSAKELVESLQRCLSETSLYRIDHYLGKETVQNLIYLRFGNSIFEPIWNRSMIDNVQITVAEQVGVGTRGGYYDSIGALSDMVQNHLMQLLSIVAMEPPATLSSEAIRDEKVKVLRSIPSPLPEIIPQMCVRAQYEGYRQADRVNPNSETETYIALQLGIDNWRWAGIPFYLRTGKYLPARSSEIVIVFKRPPTTLFATDCVGDAETCALFHRNRVHIRLQPNEGVHLFFNVKKPGKKEAQPVNMDFAYQSQFGSYSPEAYERLLQDAIVGDSTLFTRADEVLEAWRIADAIRAGWPHTPLVTYAPNTWGPIEADNLLKKRFNTWAPLDNR